MSTRKKCSLSYPFLALQWGIVPSVSVTSNLSLIDLTFLVPFEPICLALLIVSAMLSSISAITPATTVMNTQQHSALLVVSACIWTSVTPAMTLHIFFSVPYTDFAALAKNLIPTPQLASSFAPCFIPRSPSSVVLPIFSTSVFPRFLCVWIYVKSVFRFRSLFEHLCLGSPRSSISLT